MSNQQPDLDGGLTSGSETDDSIADDSGDEYVDTSTDTRLKKDYLQAQRDAVRESRKKELRKRSVQKQEPAFRKSRPRSCARKAALDQSEGTASTETFQFESPVVAPERSEVCTSRRVS
jgi:hypothetical protein